MLLYRALSSLVLWLVVLCLVFSGLYKGVFLLCSVVALLAQWEFYSMQELHGNQVFKKTGVMLGACFLGFSFLYSIEGKGNHEFWSTLEVLLILAAILGAISRPIFVGNPDKAILTVALTLFGFFYIPYLFGFMFKILFWEDNPKHGLFLLLYLAAVTKMTDVGAYIAGSVFGKHKMSPIISPKKTWEGFAGGVLIAVLTSYFLVAMMPNNLGFFRGWHVLVLGIILAVVGVVGDLGESLIKRSANIKDSGHIIPGIGGALDLIDSLLFTAPVFYCYLFFFLRT